MRCVHLLECMLFASAVCMAQNSISPVSVKIAGNSPSRCSNIAYPRQWRRVIRSLSSAGVNDNDDKCLPPSSSNLHHSHNGKGTSSKSPNFNIKWDGLGTTAIRIGILIMTCPPVGQLLKPFQSGSVDLMASAVATGDSEWFHHSDSLLPVVPFPQNITGWLAENGLAGYLLADAYDNSVSPLKRQQNIDRFHGAALLSGDILDRETHSNWFRRLADKNRKSMIKIHDKLRIIFKESYPMLMVSISSGDTRNSERSGGDAQLGGGEHSRTAAPLYAQRVLDGLMMDQQMAQGMGNIAKAVINNCGVQIMKQRPIDELLEAILLRVDRQLRLKQLYQTERKRHQRSFTAAFLAASRSNHEQEAIFAEERGQREYIAALHEALMHSLETDGMALLKSIYKIKVVNTVKLTINQLLFKALAIEYPNTVREMLMSLVTAIPMAPKLLIERIAASAIRLADNINNNNNGAEGDGHLNENERHSHGNSDSTFEWKSMIRNNQLLDDDSAATKTAIKMPSKLFRKRFSIYMLRAGVNGMICVLATLIASWSSLLSMLVDRYMDSERVRSVFLGHMELMLMTLYSRYVSEKDLPAASYAQKVAVIDDDADNEY